MIELHRKSRPGAIRRAGFARRAAIAATGLLVASVLGLLPFGGSPTGTLGPQTAQAQNFGQRTIQGKVLDDTETPVGAATVFLKNLKSRNVKSFTSLPDGTFRFAQVGMVDDYEVWAERGKAKSAVKAISSFDSRKEVYFDLKLK
jgi:hypothetical protein